MIVNQTSATPFNAHMQSLSATISELDKCVSELQDRLSVVSHQSPDEAPQPTAKPVESQESQLIQSIDAERNRINAQIARVCRMMEALDV